MISVTRPSEKPLKNQDYFKRKVEGYAAAGQENRERWAKDHPTREPGDSGRSWKSFSRQRTASEQFRDGYSKINWEGN